MSFEKIKNPAMSEKIIGKVAKTLDAAIENDPINGMADFHSELLDKFQINIDLLAEKRESFVSDREKLNTEPGLVIANHPSAIDASVILENIRRKDLKIIMKQEMVDFAQKFPHLKDNFLPASKDPKVAVQTMKLAIEHIDNGGLVMIFPTAGKDRNGNNAEFRSGFRFLLSKMRPTDMVYAFNIDIKDNTHIESRLNTNMNFITTVLSGVTVPFSGFDDVTNISLDEKYTSAEDWQKVCEPNISSKAKNSNLTTKYKSLFK
ncbi:MAG TPA: 1-acyl-sn-glycerol-3-phosphate acyltransferase [Candidatus Paceibacterota bacterium]|nr:1-acyl-sn-glycerol-3-phosphate acyltransferase [Candidatus Paceibacterota bacterium]